MGSGGRDSTRRSATPGGDAGRGEYSRYLKRPFDLATSLVTLVVVSPLLVLIALSVFLSIGRPVIFKQRRPGWHGKPFVLLKFRTMRDLKDSTGQPLDDRARMTAIGGILRSLSLDELPELLNVLRGDMSLVGPRPLLIEYLALYSPEQARRHEVRPGITGWAQVNGRNTLNWEEKFEHDVWYVDHLSFLLDVRILAKTGIDVLRREGISAEGHASMPRFLGSQKTRSHFE